MKRIQLWNLIIALLLAACQPITAPPGQSETQAGSYADPNGRFTVPIPTNWTAASKDGYALLRSPDGQIEIYLLVLEGVAIEIRAQIGVEPRIRVPRSSSVRQ